MEVASLADACKQRSKIIQVLNSKVENTVVTAQKPKLPFTQQSIVKTGIMSCVALFEMLFIFVLCKGLKKPG